MQACVYHKYDLLFIMTKKTKKKEIYTLYGNHTLMQVRLPLFFRKINTKTVLYAQYDFLTGVYMKF